MQKIHIWNCTTCSCESVEYLISAIDDSVITCDELINAADSALNKGLANFMTTVSINFHKMDSYIQ